MTIKNIYIAADGEEFETEAECLEHEQLCDPMDSVIFYDSSLERVTDCNGAIDAFEHADHVYVRDADKARTFFGWINYETGMAIPHNIESNKIYSFDTMTQGYYDLNERVNELLDIMNDIFNDVHGVEKGAEE